MSLSVVVVGAGRVGGSLARGLEAAGHRILGLLGRDEPLRIEAAELVMVAVPDSEVAAVCADVAERAARETIIVHTCGSIGLDALRSHGEMIGVLHPAVPVSTPSQDLRGAGMGILGTDASRPVLEQLVRDLGGEPISIYEESQVAYHAALVHASNHLVALIADAAAVLGSDQAALDPLLRATLDNVRSLGPEKALTGPVVRGDAQTVSKHLAALPEDLVESYRANARRALALAVAAGRLSQERADAVREALA